MNCVFWVDIEDGTGKKLGHGPLRASYFNARPLLSESGEFEFEVPASDPNIANLAEKRIAVCRYIHPVTGVITDFGGGVIDQITARKEEGGLVYTVWGNDLTRELTYRSVKDLQLAAGGAGVVNGPAQIMALAPAGWALIGPNTALPVYAGFQGESVLSALLAVGEHIGEHWRLGTGREIVWLGPASAFESSGVRAVQHLNDPIGAESETDIAVITRLEELRDAAEIVTRVIPRGSGNGDVSVTLSAATNPAPAGYTLDTADNYLAQDAAEAEYGIIERALEFKEIGPLSSTTLDIQNAANMLLQACHQHLERYAAPAKFYSLDLTTSAVLKVGQTMRVVYREIIDGTVVYDLDEVLNIVEVTQEIDATGLRTVGVTVSTIDRLPVTDEEFLAGQAQEARVFSVHPQLGVSVDNLTWRDELDNSKAANFRFWLGAEYVTIQRAVLRFQIRPLRSTVKSVASGGGSTQTSSSGGGSTQTSSSGGGGTQTSSEGGGASASTIASQHGHNISIYEGEDGEPVYFNGYFFYSLQTGKAQTQGESPAHTHAFETPDHSHSVDVPAHSHSVTIPAHTHDVTIPDHNHAMQYGIFEEAAGNTLALADLVIRLNGGANLRAHVSNIGNGWYALELTEYGLLDSVFRPAQENNALVISTAVAKTARLEAQLAIRGVVQAIALI